MDYPLPVIGFCAFSGTGKTTTLKRVIPLLQIQGIRMGVVKHAHHNFDIDHPGKDSYELRHAGAEKMLVVSRRRMALIEEYRDQASEPTLEQALLSMNPDNLDLVLVEGFKAAHYPKIEIHRPELGKPVMFPNDSDIIAIASTASASDLGLEANRSTPAYLRLNEPADILEFIVSFIREFSRPVVREQSA